MTYSAIPEDPPKSHRWESCRHRRAIIRYQDDWWMVSLHCLHHRGMFIGNLSWPTWPEARDSALRWTGLSR
jgi:hypothetical protein